jgi:hypothetical protein
MTKVAATWNPGLLKITKQRLSLLSQKSWQMVQLCLALGTNVAEEENLGSIRIEIVGGYICYLEE